MRSCVQREDCEILDGSFLFAAGGSCREWGVATDEKCGVEECETIVWEGQESARERVVFKRKFTKERTDCTPIGKMKKMVL